MATHVALASLNDATFCGDLASAALVADKLRAASSVVDAEGELNGALALASERGHVRVVEMLCRRLGSKAEARARLLKRLVGEPWTQVSHARTRWRPC